MSASTKGTEQAHFFGLVNCFLACLAKSHSFSGQILRFGLDLFLYDLPLVYGLGYVLVDASSVCLLRGWICALRGRQQIDGNQFSVGGLFMMIKLMIFGILARFLPIRFVILVVASSLF